MWIHFSREDHRSTIHYSAAVRRRQAKSGRNREQSRILNAMPLPQGRNEPDDPPPGRAGAERRARVIANPVPRTISHGWKQDAAVALSGPLFSLGLIFSVAVSPPESEGYVQSTIIFNMKQTKSLTGTRARLTLQ